MDRRKFLTHAFGATTISSFSLIPGSALAANADRHTASYGPASLDISAPANPRNLPVMIYVHGGGWRIGNRTHVQDKPGFFNDLGMIFVTIDYRLVPRVDIMTQADDVSAAISWVKNNIAQYGGDPNRLAVMGHSAGAHLAALAVFSGRAPKINALICNDTGLYDIRAKAALRGGKLPRVSGQVFTDQSQWDDLSPATYVGRASHPASLLMWSRVWNNGTMAEQFANQLRTVGASVSTFAAPNLSHAQINKNIGTGNPPQLDQAISRFLASNV